jgi:hypothetical protein
MKCLKCQLVMRYRERTGRRCPHCRQPFVFEPREGDPFSDTRFKASLQKLSDHGTLTWHPQQLRYLLAKYAGRQQRKKQQGVLAASIFGAIVAGIFGFNLLSGSVWLVLASLGGLGLLLFWRRQFRQSPRIQLSLQQTENWLQRWESVHGPVGGKMPPLQLKAPAGPTHALSESYNVSQALICDRPETVAFLLANDFHIEQRCAILSVGGYPPEDFEGLRQMLKRNPQLNVFVLHDASYNGCRLYQELTSDPAWFKGSKRVFDLGLFPRHARGLKGRWSAAGSALRPPLPGYSAADNQWLQQHEISLMALPPKTLLKQVQRLLSRHAQQASAAYARDDEASWTFESDDLLRVGEIGDSDSDFG